MSQPASVNKSTSSVSRTPTVGQGLGRGAGAGPDAGAEVGQGAGVPTVAGRLDEVTTVVRGAMSGTPGRLRLMALLAVVVCLVFAVSAFSTIESTEGALSRAGANTAQLVRIQAIHTNLVRADADETNLFLVGGLEHPAQRSDYLASLSQAGRLIAQAATAQPADGQALGALNNSLITYAGLIEQARATNRQALPVGAAYLQVASSGLRGDSLPILDALVTANKARVVAEFDNATSASAPLIAIGVIALLVLVGGMVWLSRRTHRYVNPPLVAATAAVLVTLVVGLIGLAAVSSRVNQVRNGSYAATLATATARIAAFDAKSNESLTLIARGSGGAFEKAWKASSAVVTGQSQVSSGLNSDAANLGKLWAEYASTHTQIRAADDGGRYAAAVQQATGSGSTSANATFDAFDTASSTALTSSSGASSGSLDAPRIWLTLGAWLALLVGAAAAVSAWWGVSLRLEEYR